MKRTDLHTTRLARNSLFNFVGQVFPLVVGLVTIPSIVSGLGVERFGLLSLTWVILGYFTIFDVGLGRATTKYVAEALGKDQPGEVPSIVWTAAIVQGAFGLIGMLVLSGITPLLVERILNLPPELRQEAMSTFRLLSLAVPVLLLSSSFSGALEAAQRFELVNAVKAPSNASLFLMPWLGLILGYRLPGVVALILAARFIALLALVVIDFRIFPGLRRFSAKFVMLPVLFSFGGWVTVTSIVGPILVYLDRLLIASLVSMVAVAYYTAPYEAVTRLWVIPASLTMSLFPAFSSLQAMGEHQRLAKLLVRAVKYTLLVLAPIALIAALFAHDILRIWLGDDFALNSAPVLQLLALGVLVNSVAHFSYVMLQGIGRPDIPAKFHLLELPIYVPLAWLLVNQLGIVGAAVAWTLRVMLDALLLFVAAFKFSHLSVRLLASNSLIVTSVAIFVLSFVAYGLKGLVAELPLAVQLIFFIALFGVFIWFVWRNALDTSDRGTLLRLVRNW